MPCAPRWPGETRTKEHQMSGNERAGGRILGSLGSADGKGVVRMEDRFDTDIDDVWSALTDPSRLARWYGEVEGELRLGGEFRVRVFASGWEGTGRVEACEPPRRLVVTGKEPDRPGGDVSEVTLAADGDQTRPSWSSTNRACPWTSLPPTGRRPRSMSKTSPPTSPGVSAAMPTRGWTSFFLPIRTWRPTSVRHWLLPN